MLCANLHDFLSNRHARLKVGDEVGAWLPSNVGTSAGTILGPILFILYVHDALPDISKFADDFTAISTIKNSLHHNSTITISTNLQAKVNTVCQLAHKWELDINLRKTVCMLFTNGSYKPLSIYIENQAIRQVPLKGL